MIRRSPALITKAWNDSTISPSGVAKCGNSQGWRFRSSGPPPCQSMERLSAKPFTSTMRLTSTLPIRQVFTCSRAMPSSRCAG